MTGQSFIVILALIAVVVVFAWAVADHRVSERVEASGPVLFDREGRLIGATEDLPLFRPGRHRARWFR